MTLRDLLNLAYDNGIIDPYSQMDYLTDEFNYHGSFGDMDDFFINLLETNKEVAQPFYEYLIKMYELDEIDLSGYEDILANLK